MGGVNAPDVSDPLEIHVNRPRPNDLEVPERYIADRDFALEIVNEGKPAHMHINIDDDLLDVLSLETGNHYVPRDESFRIPVSVDLDTQPVRGKLTVSTGYGAESRYVEIRVVEPPEDEQVHVDEELAEPTGREVKTPLTARIVGELSVIAIVAIAILALILAGVIVGSVTSPMVGAIAVILGVLVVGLVYVFL